MIAVSQMEPADSSNVPVRGDLIDCITKFVTKVARLVCKLELTPGQCQACAEWFVMAGWANSADETLFRENPIADYHASVAGKLCR